MDVKYLAVMGVLVALLVGGCGTDPAVEPTEQASTPAPTGTAAVVEERTEEPAPPEVIEESEKPATEAQPSWVADGMVTDGEYAHEGEFGEVRVWWRNDDEFLYLAMEAETQGWLAVGLDPEDRMKGANFVFGAISDGEVLLWDAYGTAPTGATHPPDEDLGGTNDIVAYAGREENGKTTLEAQIPLDSGDEFDKPLQPGQSYSIIVATGTSDDYDAPMAMRTGGRITLD